MVNASPAPTLPAWQRAARLWAKHWQWLAMASIAVAAIGFGYIGLTRYFIAAGQHRSFWDISYFILHLFVVESGEVSGPVPWQLMVARFLAPIVPAWAIVKAAAALFRDRLQVVRLRLTRGHVVICGLGRKGLQLVEDFRREGARIVAIEEDEHNDALRVCRDLGVVVLLGNAASRSMLEKARVQYAKYVVAICGDDGTNVETAVHTYDLVRRRGKACQGVVRCFVHVVDLKLCNFFRKHPIFAETDDPLEVKVFNSYENGARLLLEDHAMDRVRITADDPRSVHLVVVGFGQMGQSVALQAVRTGHYANGKRLRITAIDVCADARRKSFLGRYPRFDELCEVEFIRTEGDDPDSLDRIRGVAMESQTLTTVVVCLDSDSRCLSTGLSVLSKLRDCVAPVFVRLSEESGLGSLLRDDGSVSGCASRIRPFGMTNCTCTRRTLLDEELDTLAKAIHHDYVEKQREQGTPEDSPSMQPWEHLAPDLRDSNRQQADHIPVKLRTIGCYSTSAPAAGKPITELNPDELELLARMEHARYLAERGLGGWTCGPKDIARKTNPYLVPWDELLDEIKDDDRNAVRNIPHLLRTVGRIICRQGNQPE